MMRDVAELLLMELNAIDVRIRVLEVRMPDDAEVAALRRDVQAQRASILDTLASWPEVDPAETSPETLH